MNDERARIIDAVTQYLKGLPRDPQCPCLLCRRWPRFVSQLVDRIRMTP